MMQKQLFPTWRYHRDGRAVVCQDQLEVEALELGFRQEPTAHLSADEYAARFGIAAQSAEESLAVTLQEVGREAPLPTATEPRQTPQESTGEAQQQRLCTRCGNPGHNQRTCKERV